MLDMLTLSTLETSKWNYLVKHDIVWSSREKYNLKTKTYLGSMKAKASVRTLRAYRV